MRAVFWLTWGFQIGVALVHQAIAQSQHLFAPASIKITIIVGALVLVFVFLFIIPAMLTMMARASL